MNDLEQLEREVLARVAAATDETALEAVRVEALGKKGAISEALKTLGAMSPDERKIKGRLLNGMRARVPAAIAERKGALGNAALDQKLNAERVDVTLPVRPEPAGRIHPVSQVLDEATAIFADMGFAVAEGP